MDILAIWGAGLSTVLAVSQAARALYQRRPHVRVWEIDLVPPTSTERGISRKWLVLAMTNQGGGAHVDPSLDTRYTAFLANRAGLSISETSSPIVNSVASVAMRQIAHELLLTLEDQSGAGAS